VRVVEGGREGLGLAQIRQNTPKVAERTERRTQGEPQIDGLLRRVAAVGEVLQGNQCLLEGSPCLSIGRAGKRLVPSLSEIGHGLVPALAPQRMVGQ
jgi:hypothetical protein